MIILKNFKELDERYSSIGNIKMEHIGFNGKWKIINEMSS